MSAQQLTLGQCLAIFWRLGEFHCEKDLTTGETRTYRNGERFESGHEAWVRTQAEKKPRKAIP